MKKTLYILTSLALLLCFNARAESGIVEIDGKKYAKDADGKYVEVQIVSQPRPLEDLRRPARAGKFGTPHQSTWLGKDGAEPEQEPNTARGFFVSIFGDDDSEGKPVPAQASAQAADAPQKTTPAATVATLPGALFAGLSIKEARLASYELIVKYENGVVVRKASLIICHGGTALKPFDGVYQYCPSKPAYAEDGAPLAENAEVKNIPIGFYLRADAFSIEEGADGLYAEASFELVFSMLKLAEYPSESGVLLPVREGASVKSALAFANGNEITLRSNSDNNRVLTVCLRRINK